MEKIIIAAVSKNKVIGKDGKLPWHSKEELSFFKKTTVGFPVIMGRKTFESLRYPLEKRLNIIISKSKKSNKQNLIYFDSIEGALEYCDKKKYNKVFIIGGAEIFKQALGLADKILISEMKRNYDGNVFFPELRSEKWKKRLIGEFRDFTLFEYTPNEV